MTPQQPDYMLVGVMEGWVCMYLVQMVLLKFQKLDIFDYHLEDDSSRHPYLLLSSSISRTSCTISA